LLNAMHIGDCYRDFPLRPACCRYPLVSRSRHTASSEIRNRDVRVAEIVVRELEKAKPDKWRCVQARELWSPQEERQVCPGHFWLLKFGKVPGSNNCVEKKFMLDTRK
jgi:hypothetical protein